MKAIRHQLTRTKREVMVLLLMLAVSAAALATGAANAQSPANPQSPASHPCQGLSSITMIVSALTLAVGNDLTKQTTAPSGDCTLTVMLHASEHTSTDPQLGPNETCTVTVTPSLQNGGAAAAVQRSGVCGTLPVETRIDVSPESAMPTGPSGASSSASGETTALSRAEVRVGSQHYQSDVRGTWEHTPYSVTLTLVTYPHDITVSNGEIESEDRQMTRSYGVGDVHITASNRIRWVYLFSGRFSTQASLTMRPGGAYSCGHWYSGIGIDPDHSPFLFRGECLP